MNSQTQSKRGASVLDEISFPQGFLFPQKTEKATSAAITDLNDAFKEAFANPIDFPPIDQSIVQGDKVAIALHPRLPFPATALKPLLAQLESLDVVVVVAAEMADKLTEFAEVNVKLVVHDHNDTDSVAMLGVNSKAEPFYINRALFEADVAIPVGFPSNTTNTNDCIVPYFTSAADQVEFDSLSEKKQAAQVRMVNNQLGAFWGVQLVYGPGDEIHQVLVGESGQVAFSAEKAMKTVWQVDVETESDLVVATMESDECQQSWEDFCAALICANQVAANSAPIVVCCELVKSPPKKIKSAFTKAFESETGKKMSSMLKQVSEIASEHAVFISSPMIQSKTEELGLGFISESVELQRLLDKHSNGVLIRDAHRCNLQRASN